MRTLVLMRNGPRWSATEVRNLQDAEKLRGVQADETILVELPMLPTLETTLHVYTREVAAATARNGSFYELKEKGK